MHKEVTRTRPDAAFTRSDSNGASSLFTWYDQVKKILRKDQAAIYIFIQVKRIWSLDYLSKLKDFFSIQWFLSIYYIFLRFLVIYIPCIQQNIQCNIPLTLVLDKLSVHMYKASFQHAVQKINNGIFKVAIQPLSLTVVTINVRYKCIWRFGVVFTGSVFKVLLILRIHNFIWLC